MSEDCYTLEEARKELKRLECQLHGHDWTILSTFNGEPFELHCYTCYESRRVVRS